MKKQDVHRVGFIEARDGRMHRCAPWLLSVVVSRRLDAKSSLGSPLTHFHSIHRLHVTVSRVPLCRRDPCGIQVHISGEGSIPTSDHSREVTMAMFASLDRMSCEDHPASRGCQTRQVVVGPEPTRRGIGRLRPNFSSVPMLFPCPPFASKC